MNLEEIVDLIINIELIIASLIALGGFAFSLYKWIIPMYKAFKNHINTVERISEEFRPNGGSSLKDAINRLELSNKEIKEDIHIVKIESQKVGAKQWALVATQKDPVFETDEDGAFIRVNTMYANLVERSFDELRDWGWENSIHPEDKRMVFEAWSDAVKKHKSFELQFRIIASVSKKQHRVMCVANPYFNTSGDLLGYIGRYVIVEQIV